MPFISGIGKVEDQYCFSVTDFHDFDFCQFRFFVNHHLKKKYELAEGSLNMTIGTILDGGMKKFHQSKAYSQGIDYLPNLLRAQYRELKESVEKAGDKPSFNSSMKPFLTEEALQRSIEVFQSYFKAKGKIQYSLGQVDFSKLPIKTEKGVYVLWGWPDAYELGEDGVPEVVDYKFRENVERGKQNMDMDLMPKIYTLLASEFLKSKGYEKARFVVRIWQDPLDNSLYEEFDLKTVDGFADFFKQKIDKILGTREITFCEREYCRACQSQRRGDFLKELEEKGFIKMTGEEFLGSKIDK